MPDVVIYTKRLCGFCDRAKGLLADQGIAFSEIPIDNDPSRREEMIQRSGGATTVPQIFINGTHVGGCDDLFDLHAKGKLQTLLTPS